MTTHQGARRLLLWATTVLLAAAGALPATAAHAAATVVEPPVVKLSAVTYVVGTPVTVTFTPDSYGATPAGYIYRLGHQLNDGTTKAVKATSGQATITMTPTSRTTFLTVYAVAADGTRSANTLKIFEATAAKPAAEKDLNGDGVPDLLTVGGTSGLASGLWLAAGARDDDKAAGTGRVRTPAVDIGANGNGVVGDNAPSDFDGAQVITGTFAGDGFQDVLAYYPSGNSAGGAVILSGSGDGSVLQSQLNGNTVTMSSGLLTDLNGDNPLWLANAYHASANNTTVYPDLIGISGDATVGYYLNYYPTLDMPGGYASVVQLGSSTPSGNMDWNNWKIASTHLPSGTAMFLWNQSTGQLYLWKDVTFTDNGDSTGSIAYTQYQISSNWNKGVALSTLEAADINGDGVPDLWGVTPAGVATAYLISDLSASSTATVRAKQPQKLS